MGTNTDMTEIEFTYVRLKNFDQQSASISAAELAEMEKIALKSARPSGDIRFSIMLMGNRFDEAGQLTEREVDDWLSLDAQLAVQLLNDRLSQVEDMKVSHIDMPACTGRRLLMGQLKSLRVLVKAKMMTHTSS